MFFFIVADDGVTYIPQQKTTALCRRLLSYGVFFAGTTNSSAKVFKKRSR